MAWWGHGFRQRSIVRFLAYAKGHPDVWFARKDEIARHALSTPDITPELERELAEVRGLVVNTEQREEAR